MLIALLSLVVCWVGFIWGLICLCQRICTSKRRILRPKKKPARYSLLQPEPEDDGSVCVLVLTLYVDKMFNHCNKLKFIWQFLHTLKWYYQIQMLILTTSYLNIVRQKIIVT